VEVNDKLLKWSRHVQDLMTLTQTEHLTFAHTNDLMKKLMGDVNGLLLTSQREKRQFRDQCKLVQECIKLPDEATGPSSLPEPPKEEVLAEGKRQVSLQERRRRRKKLKLDLNQKEPVESRPPPPPTPCVEGPDPLQQFLQQEGLLQG
jgi:hypothetical protein